MRPMRLAAVFFVLILMAAPALAQGMGGGGQQDSGAGGGAMGGGQQQDMGAGGGAAGQQLHAVGQISKIDMQGKTMQVQPIKPGKAPMTLSWSDQTQVMDQHGKMMNMNSLKEGDQVRASYMQQDGKNVASKVQVMMPPAGAGAGGGAGGMEPQAPSGGAPQPGQSPSGGM